MIVSLRPVCVALLVVGCAKGSVSTSTTTASASTSAPAPAVASAAPTASASAVASASASAAPPPAPPPTAKDVAVFLGELGSATKAKNAAFFDAHVKFPFTARRYVYDNEGRIKPVTYKTSAELLKNHADWDMSRGFAAAVAKSPDVHSGAPDCNQPSDDKQIDYRKGARAIQLKGTTATVTFTREACSAEGHDEVYELEADSAEGFLITKMSAKE